MQVYLSASARGCEQDEEKGHCCQPDARHCTNRRERSSPFESITTSAPSSMTAVFFASHELTPVDALILQHTSHDILHSISDATVTLLLFDAAHKGPMLATASGSGMQTCVWGEDAIRSHFPRLWAAAAARATVHRNFTGVHDASFYRRFDWFHASLSVWYTQIGRTVLPAVQWFWRLELDVLFAAPLDALIRKSAGDPADVLLPDFQAHNDTAAWPFWEANRHLWEHAVVPRRHAMVSIGRYSRRFVLTLMQRHWEAGLAGFEEILLPMACANASSGCVLTHFNARTSVSSAKFRYRPPWRCAEYVAARRRRTYEIWHPVKTRDCVASFLEATQGNRTLEWQYRTPGCSYHWCRTKS